MVIFHSYVSLPEGIRPWCPTILSCVRYPSVFPDAQELEPVAQMYVWSPVDLVKDVETMVTEMVMKESRIDEKKPTNCVIDTLW